MRRWVKTTPMWMDDAVIARVSIEIGPSAPVRIIGSDLRKGRVIIGGKEWRETSPGVYAPS